METYEEYIKQFDKKVVVALEKYLINQEKILGIKALSTNQKRLNTSRFNKLNKLLSATGHKIEYVLPKVLNLKTIKNFEFE